MSRVATLAALLLAVAPRPAAADSPLPGSVQSAATEPDVEVDTVMIVIRTQSSTAVVGREIFYTLFEHNRSSLSVVRDYTGPGGDYVDSAALNVGAEPGIDYLYRRRDGESVRIYGSEGQLLAFRDGSTDTIRVESGVPVIPAPLERAFVSGAWTAGDQRLSYQLLRSDASLVRVELSLVGEEDVLTSRGCRRARVLRYRTPDIVGRMWTDPALRVVLYRQVSATADFSIWFIRAADLPLFSSSTGANPCSR